MAKAFLIGGTPRVGKTSLTLKFLKEKPILATSTDAVRYMMRQIIKESDEPNLFHLGKYTSNDPERQAFLQNHSLEVISIQNSESAIVWHSVRDLVESNIADGFDVLIEGIAVLPKFVKQLECDYTAVFLGNKSDQHFQTILDTARKNTDDWMHNLDDQTIEAFAIFNKTFSKYVENEANKHNLRYIEIHDNNFEQDIDLALKFLLKK
jgi:2-phosphoglycerate kinase